MPKDEKQYTDPFDPDLSPEHPVNQEAAKKFGLTYDQKMQSFRDAEGCLVRDQFGQPY